MAGESQSTPPRLPDPSVLTTEALDKAIYNLEKLTSAHAECEAKLIQEKIASVRRESAMIEGHRLELKADQEKALSTAMTAAEKAVQAALEASEKLRDKETAAQQLATSKAENAFVEQLAQQQTTFTLAIANVVSGLNDQKEAVTELRSEKVGRSEQNGLTRDSTSEKRQGMELVIAVASMMIALAVAVAVIVSTR